MPESEEEDELPIAPRVLSEEEAAFVPAKYDLVPAPSEQAGSPATLQPPSPAWGSGSAISLPPEAPPATPLVREPSHPAAPPPVAEVFLKKRQARGACSVQSGGASRVEGRPSMPPRPISLTLSAFTTCPSSRLCFSGGGSSFRSPTCPAPPFPTCLLRTSLRPVALQGTWIRWRCYLFDFLFRCSVFSITPYNMSACVTSCIKQCMFFVSSYHFGVKSAC
jgi:hypothetical protein